MKKARLSVLFTCIAYSSRAMPSNESTDALNNWGVSNGFGLITLIVITPVILGLRRLKNNQWARLLLYILAAWNILLSAYALYTLTNHYLYGSSGPPFFIWIGLGVIIDLLLLRVGIRTWIWLRRTR